MVSLFIHGYSGSFMINKDFRRTQYLYYFYIYIYVGVDELPIYNTLRCIAIIDGLFNLQNSGTCFQYFSFIFRIQSDDHV